MANADGYSTARRERPWLLPHNRKLRHLQGITIRNVTIPRSTALTRRRAKSVDDTPKSPAKPLAQRQEREHDIRHLHSPSDLRAVDAAMDGEQPQHDPGDGGNASPPQQSTPKMARTATLRRTSTVGWTGASALARQRKLEDVAAAKMLDTFFSLHIPGDDEPIYVSETCEKANDPNFRFPDLGSCDADILRRDDVSVKLFAKNGRMNDYRLLVELTLNMSSLQFIGEHLDHLHHSLPQNCILFHLADGIYMPMTDLPAPDDSQAGWTSSVAAPRAGPPASRVLPTSSYDALMQLSTLDACVQDALRTRDGIAAQISAMLDSNRAALDTTNRVAESRESASRVAPAASAQSKRVEAARRRRDELVKGLESRREAMRCGVVAQEGAAAALPDEEAALEAIRGALKQLDDDTMGQRRRCCEDLLAVYPIEPLPGKSLAFSIRGIHLANSDFEDVDAAQVAAALGFVAQAAYLLSFYLATPLPYPVLARGSTSVVEDPISNTNTAGPRQYPLFLKGAVRFRFEYAVFLLNKDIEVLADALGLRIVDLRQTLPNLKYLLYVATAGKGELPARKAGGVRGLLRQRGGGSVSPTLARSLDGLEAGVTKPAAARVLKDKTKANGRRFQAGANAGAVSGRLPVRMASFAQQDAL